MCVYKLCTATVYIVCTVPCIVNVLHVYTNMYTTMYRIMYTLDLYVRWRVSLSPHNKKPVTHESQISPCNSAGCKESLIYLLCDIIQDVLCLARYVSYYFVNPSEKLHYLKSCFQSDRPNAKVKSYDFTNINLDWFVRCVIILKILKCQNFEGFNCRLSWCGVTSSKNGNNLAVTLYQFTVVSLSRSI